MSAEGEGRSPLASLRVDTAHPGIDLRQRRVGGREGLRGDLARLDQGVLALGEAGDLRGRGLGRGAIRLRPKGRLPQPLAGADEVEAPAPDQRAELSGGGRALADRHAVDLRREPVQTTEGG